MTLPGAGIGNILEDVGSLFPAWGVEMNDSFKDQTPPRWESSIVWCKLEETKDPRLAKTTVAYMYDLCLKRLSRRSRSLQEDPHWSIQNILLDSSLMPSLKYFLSTYDEEGMFQLHGNHWKLLDQKKLPCSTDSYTFYLYERVTRDSGGEEERRGTKNPMICEEGNGKTATTLRRKRRKNDKESDPLDTIPFAAILGGDLEASPAVSAVLVPSPISWSTLCPEPVTLEEVFSSDEITDTTTVFSSSSSSITQVDPIVLNSSGEEFVIDHIEQMKGNPAKNPKKLLFLVHWAGYETATWEPYNNVKQTMAFYLFITKRLRKHYKLIPQNILYSEEAIQVHHGPQEIEDCEEERHQSAEH
jgi:hypothetical protein